MERIGYYEGVTPDNNVASFLQGNAEAQPEATAYHWVTPDELQRWMKVFFSRFFSQQFKRTTLPPGPKVGSVSLSPRGDWRMPDEVSAERLLTDIDELSVN